ncbi:MAG: SDR family NAD(P)-dependent oxidoreductase [Selenomonadaceae bacterium]
MGDYENKVVLVAGGANGIGREISQAFLAAGARVLVADIDPLAGGEFVAASKRQQRTAGFFAIDLREATAIKTMFAEIVKEYERVDILINNAGRGCFKPLLELGVEEWDSILQLNLRAAFVASQEFARYHVSGRPGRIINIASTRYLMSEPGGEAYAASKGGLVSLTHALAVSLGKENITVNAISPGWIETKAYDALAATDHAQHPAGRVGRPEDIARACLFLADPASGFITGENIVIDGGMTKKMIYE